MRRLLRYSSKARLIAGLGTKFATQSTTRGQDEGPVQLAYRLANAILALMRQLHPIGGCHLTRQARESKMKKLLIGLAATATVLGTIAATPAFAGAGSTAAWASAHPDERRGDGQRFSGDRDRDRDRVQLADRREDRWDRREDRWDRREDRRDARRDGGHWDRREDRWDRREDRWDRREDRRDYRWSSRDRWDHGSHNGYYYRNAWYFGPPPSRYYNDRYYRPGYRHWERGYRVPSYYRDNVVYYGDYHRLRRPPHGYRWVRADNDFLLVAIASGIIAEVILNDY